SVYKTKKERLRNCVWPPPRTIRNRATVLIWKISSTLDVPQHLPSPSLPKLLKHCLSRNGLATSIPLAASDKHFFASISKLLSLKREFSLRLDSPLSLGFFFFSSLMENVTE